MKLKVNDFVVVVYEKDEENVIEERVFGFIEEVTQTSSGKKIEIDGIEIDVDSIIHIKKMNPTAVKTELELDFD